MEEVFIKNKLIDAVKTAKSIHEGDYSSLRGKYFVTRDKIKENNHHYGDKPVNKSRMDRLEERMDRLEGLITNLAEEMRNGFKHVNSRINTLEKDINTRIDQIESRIDRIDVRLDYIVQANSLKDNK